MTGQYATTGNTSTVTPFQTFERHDVGVLLRVKPQITEGGTVRLNIYQEVSRVESITTTTGIVLSKRALESTVNVDDQQIVVLGGLIQDSQTNGTDKLPVAGDIPGHRPVVPLRQAAADQDQPAGVHQADRRAHRLAGPRC